MPLKPILKTGLTFFALTAAAIFATASANAPDREILPRDVEPLHYDLTIEPDAPAATFQGTARIEIDVHQATATVMLNAADLTFTQVSASGVTGAATVTYDKTEETATLTFPAPIAVGHHELTIAYHGKINTSASGLFYLDYRTPGGTQRAVFTQFENSDARRFMPCWDEPDRKATFTLTATVPQMQLAVSNMPVGTSKSLPQGRKQVTFEPTPRMSSYLLFFAAGDLERISRKVSGVDVGVVFKRGDRNKAQFALDAAAQLLPYYNDYFGVRYPLPKLDLISAPGSSSNFGAMENWGAIFCFDNVALIDDLSTETDRLNVYVFAAHEMAHQWFGDLVTMQWWDDLWLNEGFASWMENKATEHFHPEWDLWLVALTERQTAMNVDSRPSTHPVIQPIRDVLQADQAFDRITYDKGMAVVRMLEAHLGEQTFRNGVRRYIKAHAYGNAVTDDLWAALDQVSGRHISTLAREFTLQAGVPLIKVARSAQGVVLTQDRFFSDSAERSATAWDVPVVERAVGGGPVWQGLVRRDRPQTLSLAPGAVPVVNDGQTGYFRTRYAPELFAGLSARFGELTADDQMGLFQDTSALALAGYEPLPDILMLAGHVTPGMNPVLARTVASQLAALDVFYRDLPGRAAYAAYASGLLRPLLAQVGWSESAQDNAGTRQLRSELLRVLGRLDDPEAVTKARALFALYLKNPENLTGEPRSAVQEIVALHADAATWEQLHQLALHAPTATESQRYFRMLGAARDPVLARRALDLTLTSEASITFRPDVISAVARDHPDLAFEFVVSHLPQVYASVEPDTRVPFLANLMATANSSAAADKLRDFARAHIAPNDQRAVQTHLAQIDYIAKVRKDDLPALDRWLQTAHRVNE